MTRTRTIWLICVLLAVLTLAAFWRVLFCGFTNFDDDVYVTANRWVQAGLTVKSIKWAMTAAYQSTWQPMVWLSYMADRTVFGTRPLGYHLTNLLLHLSNVLLLFLILRRMTGSVWRSAFVAALFAVHPLRVESVAWIAERKDVLSGLFWMLSMGAYVLYTERPGWKRSLPVSLFMALGLMAKPTLVTLPFAFLVLDYWPLGRLKKGVSIGRLLIEKAPLFCLAGASVVIASIAQMKCGGLQTVDKLPIGVRLANAVYSYVVYLIKTVWPARLAVFYPHPSDTLPTWQVVGAAVLLAGLTYLALRSVRKHPQIAMGWLWYLGTMLPMIGIVQTGRHGMADRFTYIPLIGIFMAIAYGSVGVWGYGSAEESPRRPHSHTPILRTLALAIILACAAGTWHQVGYWKDDVALFTHTVAVTKRNAIVETNLSSALYARGEYKQSISHAEAALRIQPGPRAYNNIGAAYLGMGQIDKARSYYEKALQLDPDYAKSNHNLGYLLYRKKHYSQAAEHFRRALVREPDNADTHYFLAYSLAELGETDEAVRHYREALEIRPRYYQAHYNLGTILSARGDYDEAVDELRAAISIRPKYARAHHNLGNALDSLERYDEAVSEYREAIRLKPGLAEAHNNLAIDLYTLGRYDEAWKEVDLARKYGLEPHPDFIRALSAKSK